MALKSYWLESGSTPRFPKLNQDLDTEVIIVGGGITGITAAYLLERAGRRVALLERERCVRADTGHTTAHLTYVTDTRLSELVKTFGRAHAQAAWDAGLAAMQQIAAIIESEKIKCDFVHAPGYLHVPLDSSDSSEIERLREDAHLAAELDFDAEFLDEVPFMKVPGVVFHEQAKFHPVKYLAALLQELQSTSTCQLFENSPVEDFCDDEVAVTANGHKIRGKYLVIATHMPLMGRQGKLTGTVLQSKLSNYSSYALRARAPRGSVPEAMFWDTSNPYHYLRVDRHLRSDSLIYGGEDHKTGQETDTTSCYERLERKLRELVPAAEVEQRWTGKVIETPDGLPLIGAATDHQFAASGFAGNGMTFGTLGGMMAADWVLGRRNPWSDLFALDRKKLSTAWDYIKENMDYPYYMLKDKLVGPERKTLRGLQRGQGRVVTINGEAIAAYRDQEGNLVKVSAVCTHMGCNVAWNEADATWDCPCHGSRFRTDGSVLAGPAVSPLEQASEKEVEAKAGQH